MSFLRPAAAAMALSTLVFIANPTLADDRVLGDLTPGVLDDGTDPPTFEIVGDGNVNIADVVVLLRASVGLVQLSAQPSVVVQELRADVDELQARLAQLEFLLEHFSRDGDELTVTGANINVLNGTGSTEEVNGLGNLVIGYNEERGFLSDDRSGSHVLVIGARNNYSGYGGIVAGEFNGMAAAWASVLSGRDNQADGFASTVSGGTGNLATGFGAAVSAGFGNLAEGDHASIGGGTGNEATAEGSTVSGGFANTAEGADSTVSGGILNQAIGEGSTVAGGEARTAASESSVVAGSISEAN